MARLSTPGQSRTRVYLIPVSGVGEAVGDEKIGGSGVEETFNKDMTKYEMTFSRYTENRQALEPNV